MWKALAEERVGLEQHLDFVGYGGITESLLKSEVLGP